MGMTDQDAASIEVQYTRDDHIAAQRLHSAPTLRSLLLAILFIGAAIALVYFLDSAKAALVTAPFFALGGVLGGLFGWAVYTPLVARRTFARYPLAQLRFRLSLLPQGISTQSERGNTTLLWKDFIQWRTNAKTVLLYVSPRMFLFIPTRLAAERFPIDELRERARRELGPSKR
jgi:energy-coupling factor transporter transmembrane protein EcfT